MVHFSTVLLISFFLIICTVSLGEMDFVGHIIFFFITEDAAFHKQ